MLLDIKNYADLQLALADSVIMVAECKQNCKTDYFWSYHQKMADRLLGVLIKIRRHNIDSGFPCYAFAGIPVLTALYNEFKTEIKYDLKFKYFSPSQLFEKKVVQRKLLTKAIKKEYRLCNGS